MASSFFNNAEKIIVTNPSDQRDLGWGNLPENIVSECNNPQCDLFNFDLVGRSWFVFIDYL